MWEKWGRKWFRNVKKKKNDPFDRSTLENNKALILELDFLCLHLSSTTNQFCKLELINLHGPSFLPLWNRLYESIYLGLSWRLNELMQVEKLAWSLVYRENPIDVKLYCLSLLLFQKNRKPPPGPQITESSWLSEENS